MKEGWRNIRSLSLTSEDNRRLERLQHKAEVVGGVIAPTTSFVMRAALKALEQLPQHKFRDLVKSIPPTKYGPKTAKRVPLLSDEDLKQWKEELGVE
jgi:hypothetical protein